MIHWALAAALSILVAGMLVAFFRYERRTGRRFALQTRLHIDYYLLKAAHSVSHFFRVVSSDILRQMMHYIFHTLLGALLSVLKYFEKRIHDVERANRMRARASRTERTTRNKLDEIAEHKIAVALTEEEKRHRKEKHLLGG